MRLQRNDHGTIACNLVRTRVVAIPGLELRGLPGRHVDVRELLVRRWPEESAHALDLGQLEPERGIADALPFGFDFLAEGIGALGLDQDLDARLVDVVAPAFLVVHAQDGFQVGQQVLARQELADGLADDGRAPEATAHQHLEAHFARRAMLHVQADVMHFGRSAVCRRTGHRDLELARQVVELGVQRRPLADDLAVGPRILDLVGSDAGEMVRRDIADAVAAGLDGMHLDGGEVRQHVRHVFQLRPVVLQVLARGEVPVVAVVLARQVRQHAQLARGQQPVGIAMRSIGACFCM